MRFQTYFTRQKGGVTPDPVLGAASDPEPTFATNTPPAADDDNLLLAKVGGIGNPVQRVAVGYWYSAGGGVDLTAKLWVWDSASEKWYLAGTGTLKDGQLTYFRTPVLADPPQTSANLGKPSAGGMACMLTVADPGGGALAGVYHFVMGADVALF